MERSEARDDSPLLRPGQTCWRIARAGRAAVLVDAASYFAALASCVRRAEHSILIVGWDVDSRVELWRDDRDPDLPPRFGDFLNAVVSRREGLEAHLLAWDFAMIYSFEREPLPVFQLGWRTHRRVHFHLDDRHPVGACHHQKIVVVDDAVAFSGGIDLTRNRWDTSRHAPDQPDRRDPGGDPYPPFHDVQMAVAGEAAAALGDLARTRWERATGERLSPPPARAAELWPEGVEPDLTDVPVGIARTEPAYGGRDEVREVEALYREAIASAKRTLYFENQYLTSRSVAEALAARLAERDGPEVVLVVPLRCSGWLEQTTMGVLRGRLLDRLRDADRFGRLHVYYPHVAGLGEAFVNVHAKVLVADDTLLRVGSANLSNRSMGLDTECDLAVEGFEPNVRRALAGVRDRLLAEHLGVEPAEVASAGAEGASLSRLIGRLGTEERGLRPLPVHREWVDAIVPESEVVDPERPARFDQLVEEFEPEDREASGHRLWFAVAGLAALAGLAAAWRWTPLGDWLDRATVFGWIEALSHGALAPVWVAGIYLIGGLVSFPVVILILATAVVFGPVLGFCYALLGSTASAVLTYWIGRRLGRDLVRRMAGARLNRLSRRLARRGLMAVATVRVVPIAPFSVVNLVAGASHIRFRDFAFGTVLGMTPGTLVIAVFGDRLEEAVRHPGPWSLAALAGFAVALFLAVRWFRRRIQR